MNDGPSAKRELLGEMIEREPCRLSARIQRIVRDEASAADLAQQALVRALSALSTLRGEAEEPLLCTWLDRIARNLALNHVRDRKRRGTHQSLDAVPSTGQPLADRLATDEPTPEGACDIEQTHAYLFSFIQELKPELRAVFLLRDVEELSTKEAAASLGIDEGLVKWRLHQARQSLRARLVAEGLGND